MNAIARREPLADPLFDHGAVENALLIRRARADLLARTGAVIVDMLAAGTSSPGVNTMRNRAAGLLIVLVALGTTAGAHHSVPGQFDTSKPMTLTGVVSNVNWINPHVYVHLEVTEDNGTVVWKLGTAPVAMMRKANITKEKLSGAPGERVTIVAYPARDGTKHLGWITKITYADGTFFLLDGR